MDWQLAEAKNKFSEVVRRALSEGPQRVHRRKDAVVIISADEFDRLKGQETSFVEFLMSGPSFDDLDLERDTTPMREINF